MEGAVLCVLISTEQGGTVSGCSCSVDGENPKAQKDQVPKPAGGFVHTSWTRL